MRRVALPALALVLVAAAPSLPAPQQDMSFFITSAGPGKGGALGGLDGADRHCTTLAEAAGVRGKTWRAYLSQAAIDGKPAINARDRIGRGPWKNAKGVTVATSVDDLHSDNNKLGKENSLTEKGMPVNGRGDTPNTHDILTGSGMDGRLSTDGSDNCRNWTSSDSTGGAWVGHHDRTGGGANPTSWGSAHKSRGCSQQNLVATGGAGLYYCFAQ